MGGRRARRWIGLALVLSVVGAGVSGRVAAGAGDAGSEDLPVLPGVQEQYEDQYDDDGCLRTGVGERDCTVTAEQIDQARAGAADDDVRHLTGFTGPHWTEDTTRGGPVVLDGSVRRTDGPTLELTGLVRNEGAATLPAVEVVATLVGADGAVLSELRGPALVGSVRSGEPVPFSLTGPTPDEAVERVEWTAAPAPAEPVSRDLEWQSYWEQPAGERAPVENYLYREVGPGPHPEVVFGSVHNLGPDRSYGVQVVRVWLDDGGRVTALASAGPTAPDGQAVAGLDEGRAADVLLVTDGVPAGAEAITWVSGS